MSRENLNAFRTGKMTGMYLTLLAQVGEAGPMISRMEAVIAVLDLCGTVDGLFGFLGDRDAYHLDVVCALFGAIAANTSPIA